MRRIGPDLAHIGSRDGMSLGTVISFLEDPASVSLSLLHQPYGYLSDTELASLAQFIVETG
jgi:cbb3-type cytochrome oxidase cytochrome c subunit